MERTQRRARTKRKVLKRGRQEGAVQRQTGRNDIDNSSEDHNEKASRIRKRRSNKSRVRERERMKPLFSNMYNQRVNERLEKKDRADKKQRSGKQESQGKNKGAKDACDIFHRSCFDRSDGVAIQEGATR
jgi:hypothetical protein